MVQENVVLRCPLGSSGPTIWVIDTEHGDELVIPITRWWLPKGSCTCQADQIEKVEAGVIVPHTVWGLASAAGLILTVIAAVAWSPWVAILILPLLVLIWASENGTLVLSVRRRGTNRWEQYRLCRSAEDRQKALWTVAEEVNRYLIWREAASSVRTDMTERPPVRLSIVRLSNKRS